MLVLDLPDVKYFMSHLLKEDTFDNFLVRNILLQTYAKFEINGILCKEFFAEDEREKYNRNYCMWKELKPVVFSLIKGGRQPRELKIVFSLDDVIMSSMSENAAAMFLNIMYEDGKIVCTTGSSEKVFSLSKAVESVWNEYILNFFDNKKIITSTHD